jgi:hypothetical protein
LTNLDLPAKPKAEELDGSVGSGDTTSPALPERPLCERTGRFASCSSDAEADEDSGAGQVTTDAGNPVVQISLLDATPDVLSDAALPPTCVPLGESEFAEFGLRLWWSADGNAWESTSCRTGLLGEAVSFVDGPFGKAFRFQGDNDGVVIPPHESFDFFPEESFSLGFWFRPERDRLPQALVLRDLNGVWEWGVWQVEIASGVTVLQTGIHNGNIRGTTPIALDTWHHVVLSYASGMQRVFLDGAQEIAATYRPILRDPNAVLRFGYRDPNTAYLGAIDEIQIFERALSASDASQLHSTWQERSE